MRALLFEGRGRLGLVDIPRPEPGPGQVLLAVSACGLCRTDLHIVDGELLHPKLPLVLGHQVVGTVAAVGPGCEVLAPGRRVGLSWLARTCGRCRDCRRGRENLCPQALFTGYHVDGGLAELCVADERACLEVPGGFPAAQAAPLLCAGLIGYRALRAAGDGRRLGIYGFGAAAHILCQVARHQGREVLAFTRPGDRAGQAFARELGAAWAGGSDEAAPGALDAAILFAPAGELVPVALRAVAPGGRVVCAGIHMSDVPSFPYALLWGERSLASVANLTRADGVEFLELAARVPLRTVVREIALEEAPRALEDLRAGRVRGAAVVVM